MLLVVVVGESHEQEQGHSVWIHKLFVSALNCKALSSLLLKFSTSSSLLAIQPLKPAIFKTSYKKKKDIFKKAH